MARKPKQEEVVDDAPQDEAVESPVDSAVGTEAPVASAPSLAEQIGFGDDERYAAFKDIADPIELSKKLKEQVDGEQERFDRQLAERQREWQAQIQNSPSFIQYQRHQQELANKPAEPEVDPLAEWWKPPQVNRELIAHWTEQQPVKDEAGNVVGWEAGWKKNAPADLVKAVEDYDLYQQKWRSEFHSDPRGKLMPLVENVARKIAQEQFNSYAQEYDERQFFERLSDPDGPKAKWLFAHDATGQVVFGLDCQPVLSNLGERLFAEARALHEQSGGAIGKKRAMQIAERALLGDVSIEERRRAAQAEAAKEAHEDERIKTLNEGAKRRPNRSGSLGKPENPKRPAQTSSFRDALRQDLDALGVTDQSLASAY